MLHKKEFEEIQESFKHISNTPYLLITNLIFNIGKYDFFKKSELSTYLNINIDDYPVGNKKEYSNHIKNSIDIINSIPYKKHSSLITLFRFYIEEYLYLHSDEVCPRCCYQFGLMFLKYGDMIGMGCPECGFFKNIHGIMMNVSNQCFTPLKNIELEQALSIFQLSTR